VIASVAAIGVGYLALDKLVLSKPGAAGAQTAAPTARSSPSTPSAISEKSIAVLPFVDMSEKKDQEYFADGMAEEVLDLLAKIPGLTVIGRTSSFQFKTATEDLRSIGAKLGAAYVVEGSVRKAGDQIRVTAQLIDVRNGAHRWSDSYDRKISDVFKVQDDIAVHLARALDIAVSADFGSRASMPNTDAYDLYLRGLHADDRGTKESDEEAVADFQQALHIAPGFAAAAVALSRAYEFIGDQGWLPTHEAFEHAREAAEQAIQLDPTNGAAHAELAEVHIIYDWNWSAADDELKQATKLGANAEAMLPAARLAASRGKWDEAAHLLKMGLAIDPLNPQLHEDLAFNVYFRSGHFAEAESSLRRLLEISPSYGSGRYFLGISLLLQRRFDEALTILRQETLDDGQLEGSAMVYYAMGRKAESDAALKKGIERNADSWSSEIARVYAFRGERDQAMKWLERAYTARDEDLYFIKGDPLMKNLEGDPRYQAFLRKMSLPE
jgi:TolB-like protein/Tfp pilus assembly protein PilF